MINSMFIRIIRSFYPFSVLHIVNSRLNKTAENILDVGCGKGEPMSFINKDHKNQNPEFWNNVPFHSVREMLQGIIMWSHIGGDHNPALLSLIYPLSSKIQTYTKNVSLSEVLQWAVANIFSDEERKAAANGGFVIPLP